MEKRGLRLKTWFEDFIINNIMLDLDLRNFNELISRSTLSRNFENLLDYARIMRVSFGSQFFLRIIVRL